MRPDDRRPDQGGGGIPDGLLIALLGFLVGLTLLVWSATGLSGLFAHGAWPDAVTLSRTPLAVRSLVSAPQDLTAAWPDTPADQLSGYGLFWGLLISQLMILLVLTVFTMGTLARWRAVRTREKTAGRQAKGDTTTGTPPVFPGHSAPPAGGYVHSTGPVPGAHAEPTAPAHPHTGGYGHHADPAIGTPAGPHSGSHSGGLAPPAGFPATTSTPATPVPEPRHGAPSPPLVPAAEAGAPTQPPHTHPAGTHPTVPLPTATATEAAAPAAHPRPGVTVPSTPAGPGTGGWAKAVPMVILGTAKSRRPAATQAVRDAEGPVLVVTSDPTLWSDTKDARAKLGPVLLYDPAHRCDTPARLHWSPIAGCEDKPTALARATALLAPIRPAARIDQAMADTAETLLRSYLHAAAIDNRTIRHLHRWAQGSNVQEAVRTLRTNPKAAPGAAGELESALTSHPERRDIAQQLTARALSALSTVNVRESCTPNRADTLALDSFVHEGERSMWSATPSRTPRRTHPPCPF